MSKLRLTCRCKAYPFPHRYQSGECDGWSAVEEVFEHSDSCHDCPFALHTGDGWNEPREIECRVLGDRTGYTPDDCPSLEEVVTERVK